MQLPKRSEPVRVSLHVLRQSLVHHRHIAADLLACLAHRDAGNLLLAKHGPSELWAKNNNDRTSRWLQQEPIPKGGRTPQFTSQVLTPQSTRKGPDPFWDRL
jgi:hypothetical protein